MSKYLEKEYLSQIDCNRALRSVSLSRSDTIAIPRHLAVIFSRAEASGQSYGQFEYDTGKTIIPVTFERQSSSAQSFLLHRDVLLALVPELGIAKATAMPPAAQKVPRLPERQELKDCWLTHKDLVAGMTAYLKRQKGTDAGKLTCVNLSISNLRNFTGLENTVMGIRCHKYHTTHGQTGIAVHKDDAEKFYAYAYQIFRPTAVPTAERPHISEHGR